MTERHDHMTTTNNRNKRTTSPNRVITTPEQVNVSPERVSMSPKRVNESTNTEWAYENLTPEEVKKHEQYKKSLKRVNLSPEQKNELRRKVQELRKLQIIDKYTRLMENKDTPTQRTQEQRLFEEWANIGVLERLQTPSGCYAVRKWEELKDLVLKLSRNPYKWLYDTHLLRTRNGEEYASNKSMKAQADKQINSWRRW